MRTEDLNGSPTPASAKRSWRRAAVVAVVGGPLGGAGAILVLFGVDSPWSFFYPFVVYVVIACGSLIYVVARSAPNEVRDATFWVQVLVLVGLGLLAAWGAAILFLVILFAGYGWRASPGKLSAARLM